MTPLLDSIPKGYSLHEYDDCGQLDTQPHMDPAGWLSSAVHVRYEDLDPKLDYALAVTCSNSTPQDRMQTLHANGVELHGPQPLPKGQATRLMMKIPKGVVKNGRMDLEFKDPSNAKATVSAIELWASAPPRDSLRVRDLIGSPSSLEGRVVDLKYAAAAGAEVVVKSGRQGGDSLTTTTDENGGFRVERKLVESLGAKGDIEIQANHDGKKAATAVSRKNLFFDPVRYRPIAAKTHGLRTNRKSLDGMWRINVHPTTKTLGQPLDAPGWGDFSVPGQWLQQGYESEEGGILANHGAFTGKFQGTTTTTLTQKPSVVVAREFDIPENWAGSRIFLRFDAIHAGTHYRLNGKYLGYSENLFTPVEWEITGAARPGQSNLLYLGMTVKTVSEALSYASDYAFHNLGGIDRSVSIYALPKVHVSEMHIDTDLDSEYRDADLRMKLTLDSALKATCNDLSLVVTLEDPKGNVVTASMKRAEVGALPRGKKTLDVSAHVADPLKWNAEQPHLYSLAIELKQGRKTLERIERKVGFRKVEIIGSQLYVNGVRVKLAGANHHEIDPLTGRANTMRRAEQDVKLLKGANLNYIRTSHYPPTQELMDAADRLGMYVEVEAPFSFVRSGDPFEKGNISQVMTPVSAMIDYHHAHPSAIIWSVVNESVFYKAFEMAARLCKELDPSRPTTFNGIHPFWDDPKRVCDIANAHYPPMPYDEYNKADPRPMILDEYFFPVCHEQTDVRINPGLRELWGHGHSDPDSEWGRQCSASYDMPKMKPGAKSGFWSHIYHSDRVIGGAIWAAIDEPYYFANGKHCGFAWSHGFWGLVDAWRRPKPEWWFSKMIFSPVWFFSREISFAPGQTSVRVAVENRYAFTDFSALRFDSVIGGKKQRLKVRLAPASQGEIEIPIPKGTQTGEKVFLRVTDGAGELVNIASVQLGKQEAQRLPKPAGGELELQRTSDKVLIQGEKFSLAFSQSAGQFVSADPDHRAAVISFPALHVTRYDFGDLAFPNMIPYAEFPDPTTRVVESATVTKRPNGVEITVRDRYEAFAGSVSWLIEAEGMGRVTYDYTYSGEEMNTRETGVRFLLQPECDTVRWRRWSEWGDTFPKDQISRTEGTAQVHRAKKWGPEVWNQPPAWPWALDETELGTADFRSMKFNVYEASVESSSGTGLRVYANADVHVRPALAENSVQMHVISQCRMGQIILKPGDRLQGCFTVEILR